MKVRGKAFDLRHALALALACTTLFVASALAGEPIRFSKPAVPIVAPPKDDKIPEARERGFDFSRPDFTPALAPHTPQPLVRREAREEKREEMHRFLRTPEMFTDPDEEKARRKKTEDVASPMPRGLRPPSPFMENGQAAMRPDQPRGLLPVTDLNWRPGELNGRKADDARLPAHARTPFIERGNEHVAERFLTERMRPDPMFDFSQTHAKQKLTPAQLQRQSDFQQLLNPNAGLAGREPNSLQPVVAANAKSSTLAIPTIGGPTLNPRPNEDALTAAFNERQDRWRGPAQDDIGRKYSPSRVPSSSAQESKNQTPLNREPIRREFPGRKGI